MRKQRMMAFGFLLSLGFLGFGFYLGCSKSAHYITEEGFERIQNGMTLADVEGILLVPPGSYTKWYEPVPATVEVQCADAVDALFWIDEELEIVVLFDDQGRVCYKIKLRTQRISVFTLLRNLLGF